MSMPLEMAEIPGLSPSDVLSIGRQASSAVQDSFDRVWIDLLKGSGIYTAMINVAVLIALVALAVFFTHLAKRTMAGDLFGFSELIWPVIVIFLLSNQGALLSDVLLELRDVLNVTNERVLQQTVNGLTLQKAFEEANLQSASQELMAVINEQCRTQPTPMAVRQCVAQKREQFNSYIERVQAEKGVNDGGFWQTLQDYWASGVDAVEGGIDAVKDGAIAVASWPLGLGVGAVFSIFQMAFQWILEIALILMAIVSPLAVASSLLPTQSKPLYGWLSGFYTLGMAKLGFNIIAGIGASVAVSATDAINPLFLSIFLGLFAPVLALVVGSGSGIALFVALSALNMKFANRTLTFLAQKTLNLIRRR